MTPCLDANAMSMHKKKKRLALHRDGRIHR